MTRAPAVAVFTATALSLSLTAGAGLGLWLLFARVFGLGIGDLSWLALVQVHGAVQLFGFAGLFAMGIGLHILPRFRGADASPRALVAAIYAATVIGVILRVAQPFSGSPARGLVLAAGSLALVIGTLLYAAATIRTLRAGRNPHRPDEIVIALGACVLPIAAALELVALRAAPLVVDGADDDRAVWLALLGALSVSIFGVWARLGPAFVASAPVRVARLYAGVAFWSVGAVGLAMGFLVAAWSLLVGIGLVVWALGVFGPTIARQPLAGHARLTRLAVRSAYAWAVVGAIVLVGEATGALDTTYLVTAAARHAFALGFVTLMIFGVAARALPTFLGRELRSPGTQLVAILLTNAAVALRVVPQALGGGNQVIGALVGFSGVLAYAGLVAFAISLVRSVPARANVAPAGHARPIDVRF